MIQVLQSGKYNPEKTGILMPTTGDACRGACYIGLLKKALKKAGYERCKVLTINVRHIEDDIRLKYSLSMAIRGLFALYYGDLLLLFI